MLCNICRTRWSSGNSYTARSSDQTLNGNTNTLPVQPWQTAPSQTTGKELSVGSTRPCSQTTPELTRPETPQDPQKAPNSARSRTALAVVLLFVVVRVAAVILPRLLCRCWCSSHLLPTRSLGSTWRF